METAKLNKADESSSVAGVAATTSKKQRSALKSNSTINQDNSNYDLRAVPKKKHVHFGMSLRDNFYDLAKVVNRIKFWNKRRTSGTPEAATETLEPKKDLKTKLRETATHVIDPSKGFYYGWLIVVSITIAYNFIFVIGRTAFDLLQNSSLAAWLILDYSCDIIYLLDILVRFRTGYLEQGLLVTDTKKLSLKYVKSLQFKFDVISILPFDFAAIRFPVFQPHCRFNRLLRVNRLLEFRLKSETITNYPYIFRITFLFALTLVLIHWNGCIYYLISSGITIGTDGWTFSYLNDTVDLYYAYVSCFYWSTLVLTTIAEVNNPSTNTETLIMILNLLVSIVLFASIVGNIGSVIENMNLERDEFQNKVDSIKGFLKLRRVDQEVQQRIVKLYDYKWNNKQNDDGDTILSSLTQKLAVDVAVNVHLETLKKVTIFSDCEVGFLEELVTKLKLRVYSPDEYVCRKGDIGKEMFFIKKGKLQVVSQDGKTVFVTLQKGAYFGELSILNIEGNKNGNRRTANVKSVGYSDLYCLTKYDLWDALSEYPETKKVLLEKGKAILRKDNLLLEDNDGESMKKEIQLGTLENFEELDSKKKIEVLAMIQDNLEKQLVRFNKRLDENIDILSKRIKDFEDYVESQA